MPDHYFSLIWMSKPKPVWPADAGEVCFSFQWSWKKDRVISLNQSYRRHGLVKGLKFIVFWFSGNNNATTLFPLLTKMLEYYFPGKTRCENWRNITFCSYLTASWQTEQLAKLTNHIIWISFACISEQNDILGLNLILSKITMCTWEWPHLGRDI